MKLKKSQIQEIIDGNNNLIGYKDTPSTGANKETEAKGTTDDNMTMHSQRFGDNFLGRFGFYFYEGEEKLDDKKNDLKKSLKDKIARIMYDKYTNILNYYIKNPKKLLDDYKLHKKHDYDSQPEEKRDIDLEWADKIIKTIKPFFDEKQELTESEIIEDKINDKKEKKDIKTEKEKKDLVDKKMEKIAGLIQKMDTEHKDKIITLLEKK